MSLERRQYGPTVSRDAGCGCVVSNLQDLLVRIHQNGQKCCCQVIPGVEANLDWNELLTGVLSLRREEESKICDFYSIMRIVCFSVMSFI